MTKRKQIIIIVNFILSARGHHLKDFQFPKFVMQLISETLMCYVNNVGTIYDFRLACKK